MYRYDLIEIKSPKIDQNGYLVADAFPTKTGVFKYTRPDGTITRELRHEDDVFKPESMESLKNRPIVDEHPHVGALNAGNTTHQSAGHVGESIEKVGDHIKANLIVMDDKLIAKMQGKSGPKKIELSCGYTADVIEQSGIYARTGEKYDHRQTNIVYNHLASVRKGRAGPTAQIHLDAEDALIDGLYAEKPEETEPAKKKSTAKGDSAMTIKRPLPSFKVGELKLDKAEITYDENSEKAIDVLTQRNDALQVEAVAIQDKYDKSEAGKSKAEGERDQAVEDAKKKKTDHAELDKMADERADVKGVASHLKLKDYADKSNADIKKMVVAAHNPDIKVDDLDDGNIEGRYGMICDGILAENKGLESLAALKKVSSPVVKKNDGEEPKETPRQKIINDMASMHGKSEGQVRNDWQEEPVN